MDKKTEEFVLFGSKEQTDVIWLDKDNNEFYIHKLVLEMRSKVLCNIEWEKDKKTIIKTEFSKSASLEFLQLLYCIDIKEFQITNKNLMEVCKICFQYDVHTRKCYKTIKKLLNSHMLPIDHETDLNLIQIANCAAIFKQMNVIRLVCPRLMREKFLSSQQMNKLTNEFKQMFLLTHQKPETVIRVVEAKHRNGKFYLADVLDEERRGTYVHFQGWSISHDCWISNSNEISKIGTREIDQVSNGHTKLKFLDTDEQEESEYEADDNEVEENEN